MKRMILIMILITVAAAVILIMKILDYKEEDLLEKITEPIPLTSEAPVTVELPKITGSTLPEEEIRELTKAPEINKTELDLLSRLIQAEAGADWCTDELQRAVGSVVLNRIDDDRYPNTMKEVIYQPGQYSTAKNGKIDRKATDRARKNAEFLLRNGSTLPEDVIFQANFKQGKVYTEMQGVYFGK